MTFHSMSIPPAANPADGLKPGSRRHYSDRIIAAGRYGNRGAAPRHRAIRENFQHRYRLGGGLPDHDENQGFTVRGTIAIRFESAWLRRGIRNKDHGLSGPPHEIYGKSPLGLVQKVQSIACATIGCN